MPVSNKGQVMVNGLEFHYLHQGRGPLMLCLHGFPDNANTFGHQLEYFAAKGFHVVAPYMRGYAPSAIPQGGYQSAQFGADVCALIDALGYDHAVLIGHDWGATAAYAAAVLQPARVSRLITIAVPYGTAFATALLSDFEQQKRSWYMFFFQQALADMAIPLNEFKFIEHLWQEWSPSWQYRPEQLLSVQRTLGEPGVLKAALAYYRTMFNPQLQDPSLSEDQARVMSESITVPALYLHGVDDGCIGVDLSAGMEAFFTQGLELHNISGAGHFVHQEKPQQTNQLIADFLSL